jgi:PIN domain nuclease of toxin-antitoxin system
VGVVIKRGLGRDDFQVDPRLLRRGLRDNGYSELAITSEHAIAIDLLPPIHKESFRSHSSSRNRRSKASRR